MNRRSNWTKWVGIIMLAIGMLGLNATRATAAPLPQKSGAVEPASPKYEAWLNKQVHHQLAMTSWYGIFDELGYSVNGTEVTLTGKVTKPITKNEAVARVKKIEGVTRVNDQISVLPLSGMDNRIRRAEYRSIFSEDGLGRYAMGVNPAIHIIVENGHVTLVGYVDNAADSRLAYMRANAVPGVFSVTNNLQVAKTA